MYWIILVTEFIILFLTSRTLFQSVYQLLYRFLRSHTLAMHIVAAVFLPGTIVHELGHLLTAELLQVHTGEIEFFPIAREGELKLGSVQIAKTDFIRRFFIGVAPVIAGSGVLLLLVWLASQGVSDGINFSLPVALKYSAILYGLFVTANTMFSSKKDLEGAVEFLGVLLFVSLVIFFSFPHVFFSLIDVLLQEKLITTIQSVDYLLLVPVTINVFAATILRVLIKRT